MLIVLTGSVSTYKRTLANAIKATLNTIALNDGYTLKYTHEYFEIKNSEDAVVYKSNDPDNNTLLLNDDGSSNDAGKAIFDDAQAKIDNIFKVNSWNNHFEDGFVDLAYDLGVSSNKMSFTDSNAIDVLVPSSYQDILDNYTNRITDTHVITGVFANWILEDLKTDIGADNIKVINLQRNPSASFFNYNNNTAQWDVDSGEKVDDSIDETARNDDEGIYERWINGELCSYKAASLDWVDTVKFEDIITTGLTINGTAITLPEGFANFNGTITAYENEFIKDRNGLSSDDITALNNKISTFDFATNFPTDLSEAENAFLDGINMNTYFPSNLFTELGYTAMTYDQIIAS